MRETWVITVCGGQRDSLRLRPRPAQLKQFRVGILIRSFHAWERRYKVVHLAHRQHSTNIYRTEPTPSPPPTHYTLVGCRSNSRSCPWVQDGDGIRAGSPEPSLGDHESDPNLPTHKRASQQDIVSVSSHQLWDNWNMLAERLGRNRTVHELRPFPVSRDRQRTTLQLLLLSFLPSRSPFPVLRLWTKEVFAVHTMSLPSGLPLRCSSSVLRVPHPASPPPPGSLGQSLRWRAC